MIIHYSFHIICISFIILEEIITPKAFTQLDMAFLVNAFWVITEIITLIEQLLKSLLTLENLGYFCEYGGCGSWVLSSLANKLLKCH